MGSVRSRGPRGPASSWCGMLDAHRRTPSSVLAVMRRSKVGGPTYSVGVFRQVWPEREVRDAGGQRVLRSRLQPAGPDTSLLRSTSTT